MLDSNSFYVVDENGDEKRMVILFTFDNKDYGKSYVVFQDPEGAADEIQACGYTDEGELFPIESDEEWDMVEEVINTFLDTEDATDDE
ncbi:MAG: DUF1292 domain-containing protein [Allobaculum sp.]|nr:DUF1292 domain-containing protein [Allobaculum sp.]MDE5758660.1 DUF1292 domain-containing protein [Allobaculum sp.]